MDSWTWALLAILSGAVLYYLKKKSSYFADLGVPSCQGWPVLGNMAGVLFRRKHFTDMVIELYNAHPGARYVGAYDFVRPVIVLRDLDLIKSIGIKNFEDFPDHKSFIDDTVDPLFGANLFNIAGEKWKETRNMLSPAFTSSKMKAMYELIIECAANFTDYLERQSKETLSMVATKDLFTKYTNDVVATCAFGISVDTFKDPRNDFYVLGKEATNLDGFQGIKFLVARAFPQAFKYLGVKFVSDRVAKFFENIVGTTVKTRDEQGIHRPDMLQLMMDARGKGGNKHVTLDITNMTAQAFIFFFGGFDTTSTQMCAIAHELAINPDIQEKLQAEIDQVMQRTAGRPKYEDVAAMPYLDAVFNESMRKHTQGAILDRLCVKAFELPPAVPGAKPFVVKPGMNVWIPAAGIHLDPKYYENPKKFDPDRYLGKKVSINDVTNLGFGVGPRSCIGNRFAILETKILFFFMLSKFNLVPNAKTAIPFVYGANGFSIKPKGGYWLAIEPRNHRNGSIKSQN